MTRFSLLRWLPLTALLVCSVFAVYAGKKAGEGKYRIRYATLSASSDPQSIAARYMQQMLHEKSGGRMELVIYENKQLANSDREKAELVQMDIIEMVNVPSSALASLSSNLRKYFIFDYPYLFRSNEEIKVFLESELGGVLQDDVQQYVGIKCVGGFKLGWQVISNNSRAIASPGDMNGLKIRTMPSDLMMDFIRLSGGSPTPLAYGEVYTALQQKTIDGMMTSTGLYVSDGFFEVQRHLFPSFQSANVHAVLINDRWYNALPPELKPVFDECVQAFIDKARVESEIDEANALTHMKNHGLQISTIADEKAFHEIGAVVTKNNRAIVGEDFLSDVQTWLESYRTSRAEANEKEKSI